MIMGGEQIVVLSRGSSRTHCESEIKQGLAGVVGISQVGCVGGKGQSKTKTQAFLEYSKV